MEKEYLGILTAQFDSCTDRPVLSFQGDGITDHFLDKGDAGGVFENKKYSKNSRNAELTLYIPAVF